MKLRAGDLEMNYDRGFLRYIKLGNHEVLRMIYFALRDHNWDTMDGTLSDIVTEVQSRSFSISYTWRCNSPKFPFVWKVQIVGNENEEIIYSIDGTALDDLRKNRTGFCILHSIPENINNPCTITAPNGEITMGVFPEFISPDQPFFNIRKMHWPLGQFGEAELHFTGDVFEMEDQRNWTDASFKTYCTPLSIPFPADLKRGDKIKQKVRLTVNKVRSNVSSNRETCVLTTGNSMERIPAIGIGAPTNGTPLQSGEIEVIRDVDLDFYQFEIDLSHKERKDQWQRLLVETIGLKLQIHLSLFFTEEFASEAHDFAKQLEAVPNGMIIHILLLQKGHKTTPTTLIETVVPIFRKLTTTLSIKMGGGTNAYFTELNRGRVTHNLLDFIAYSVNPQVHAFDNASMTETLSGQTYTVKSAQVYFDSLPIHIVPITLKPRFNPNATSPDQTETASMPEDVDPRQMSLYGAAWTLGSIVNLARSGVALAVYYECVGWKGIWQGLGLPPGTKEFNASKGFFFPIFHVLQVVLSQKESEWIELISNQPLSVQGIMFKKKTAISLLIANYQSKSKKVELKIPIKQWRTAVLDEESKEEAGRTVNFFAKKITASEFEEVGNPAWLTLPPNGIAYVEIIN